MSVMYNILSDFLYLMSYAIVMVFYFNLSFPLFLGGCVPIDSLSPSLCSAFHQSYCLHFLSL
jgi:hypothetical protein